MKHAMHNRILSLLLALMLLVGCLPLQTMSAVQEQSYETILSQNIDCQAIFDWWSDFLLVKDPAADDIVDLYDGDDNWFTYDSLGANALVVTLTDYYYDADNGFMWYKVDGDNLPSALVDYPWVLYCLDTDIEDGYDPYLAVYDADVAIQFVYTTYTAGDGTEVGTTFVLSGPASFADADISVTYNADLAYTTSVASRYDSVTGSAWYHAFDISVTLNGNLWTAESGSVDIRYLASSFGSNTYNESLYYGGAFVLDSGIVTSFAVTDLYGLDASDTVTISGNCTLVFELLCESYEEIDAQGYFSGESVLLYQPSGDASVEYIAPAPPETVNVIGAFSTDSGDWYLLDCDCAPEQGYILVSAEYITFVDVEYIYWFLLETVSKDGFAEVEEDFAEDLAQFTFSADQLEYLQTHLDAVPYRADMVYTPWSGKIGPLMPPVKVSEAAVYSRMARSATLTSAGIMPLAEAEDTNNNGLELSKNVVDNGDGTYTITIEAYTTGEVQVVTKKTAVDVILVLDVSTSMDEKDISTVTAYSEIESGTAESVLIEYGTVYVLIDGSYQKVKITGTNGVTTESYTKYENTDSNYTASNLYSYINAGNTLYYLANGTYYPVSTSKTGKGNKARYTFTYSNGALEVPNASNLHGESTLNATLYTKDSVTLYSEYIYTYQDASGNTVTKTYAPDDSIVNDDISYYYASETQTVERIEALQDAVQAFTSEIIEAARGNDGELGTADDVNHRVSIITYNQNATIECPLKDVSTETGVTAVEKAASDDSVMYDATGTHSDYGLSEAIEIFNNSYAGTEDKANDPVDGERQRVVLFFTDGYPSTSGSSYFDTEYATDAINHANTLKNDLSATIYSVAILPGADPSAAVNPTVTGESGDPDMDLVNAYLHAVSSNYKNATAEYSNSSMTITLGDGANNDYYLTASSTDDLNGIFNTVSNVVVSGGSNINLGTSTVIKDIITPQFVLPENASAVRAYQVPYTGNGKWGTPEILDSDSVVSIDPSTSAVNVTGFDFNHNFVAETGRVEGDTTQVGHFYGRKLIIQFDITSDQDFLGGSDVPTNGDYSGLYNDSGVPIEYFPQPTYSFGLKDIDTVAQDRHIYLGNSVNLIDILDLFVRVNDTQGGTLQVRADGINNLYVDLVYTVTVADSQKITYTIPHGMQWYDGTWSDNSTDWTRLELTEDTLYKVECTMIDINDSSNTRTATGSANIYVYEPSVTFTDSEYQYQASLGSYSDLEEFLDSHCTEIVWSHPSQSSTPEGTAPAITYTYKYDNTDAFLDLKMNSEIDVPVSVTATINGTSVNTSTDVTISRNCQYGCGSDSYQGFVVHVKTANILIQKSGMLDDDTSYYKVVGSDGSVLYVTIHGNSSVLIKNVTKGVTYSITELVSWSWEYTNASPNASVSVVDYDTYTVTFNNKAGETGWLESESSSDNIFTG